MLSCLYCWLETRIFLYTSESSISTSVWRINGFISYRIQYFKKNSYILNKKFYPYYLETLWLLNYNYQKHTWKWFHLNSTIQNSCREVKIWSYRATNNLLCKWNVILNNISNFLDDNTYYISVFQNSSDGIVTYD